ncbi:hypothetical protein DFS33DRAFT_1414219 [Desarmillaria ectypa]|nr:hypothetical protein DFS33DRAFT_1414219 [Desarmillaria ectypa]
MIPLVIVEGSLGGVGPFVWGNFEQYLNASSSETRLVFFASVGPVSSLYPTIQFESTTLMMPYTQWTMANSIAKLIDTVDTATSTAMGGPTIIKLQYLLKQGYFGGPNHPDMILSITTISSPFRGTPIVYTLGEHIDGAPAVRPWSIGDFMAKVVHVIAYLKPLLPESFDIWHSESRALSFHEIPFSGFLRELWKSSWATSRDAAPFDVTFMATDEREAKKEGEPNSGTFYKSFAAFMASSFIRSSEKRDIQLSLFT